MKTVKKSKGFQIFLHCFFILIIIYSIFAVIWDEINHDDSIPYLDYILFWTGLYAIEWKLLWSSIFLYIVFLIEINYEKFQYDDKKIYFRYLKYRVKPSKMTSEYENIEWIKIKKILWMYKMKFKLKDNDEIFILLGTRGVNYAYQDIYEKVYGTDIFEVKTFLES